MTNDLGLNHHPCCIPAAASRINATQPLQRRQAVVEGHPVDQDRCNGVDE